LNAGRITEVQSMDQTHDDEFLPTKLLLIDNHLPMVDAWKQAFEKFSEVEILAGDYFQRQADAMVSPANSFGIMDGGIDLAIRKQFGLGIQARVQKVIIDRYHGEMPVGAAEVIETGDARWKYLIAAPTMRMPEIVVGTLQAYLAFRAILVAIENFNRQQGHREIDSLLCCGLCTGVGRMPPSTCAAQMRIAYLAMLGPPAIGRFESIHELHRTLKRT